MTDDLISRADAIKALRLAYPMMPFFKELKEEWAIKTEGYREAEKIILNIPSAQPKLDEWCTDCKEYNHETHSCPRWNRVIRTTVEEVKANNQPKRGEWINKHEWANGFYERECSICGAMKPILMHTAKMNFCPNCGARMKGADDEIR